MSGENQTTEQNTEVQLSEQLSALFDGTELSEEFKGTVGTLFEAEIKNREAILREELESEYETKLEESVEEKKSELAEQVNAYLGYVVEEWFEKNELAIEQGMRTEIAENFIGQMINVFKENYVDLPEEKYDLVASLKEQVSGLEEKLNEQVERNMSLKADIKESKREAVFADVTSGLADTEVERFTAIAEGIDYENDESYREKLDIIKEKYFGDSIVDDGTSESLTEETIVEDVDAETRVTDPAMASLVESLNRVNR